MLRRLELVLAERSTTHQAGAISLDTCPVSSDFALEQEVPTVDARWNGRLIASSDDTVVVEGNHYFPADAVDTAMLRPSDTTSVCPWKGNAHYYSLQVDGADNLDAAWYYPDPKPEAANIFDRIAFWKGVEVG